MVTVKILKDKTNVLISTTDIPKNTILFTCSWFNQASENPFFLPKNNLNLNSSPKDVFTIDDLFIKVALSGFGEYIKANPKGNVYPKIDYINREIAFISNTQINKDENITYLFSTESFPNVTFQ